MTASITAHGTRAWTEAADQDASLAAHIAEAEWHNEGLTEAEAILLMNKNFQKIVQERKLKEEGAITRQNTGGQVRQ